MRFTLECQEFVLSAREGKIHISKRVRNFPFIVRVIVFWQKQEELKTSAKAGNVLKVCSTKGKFSIIFERK